MKKFIFILLFTISNVLIAQNKQLRTFPDMEDKLDTRFPIENFKDENGRNFSPEYLKGKYTLINLWSTTCAPCLREIPLLNNFKSSLPDVNFIGITYDKKEKIDNFIQKNKFDFMQIPDAGKQLESYLTIQRFPMTLLINKEGIITDVIGHVTEEKLPGIREKLSGK